MFVMYHVCLYLFFFFCCGFVLFFYLAGGQVIDPPLNSVTEVKTVVVFPLEQVTLLNKNKNQ